MRVYMFPGQGAQFPGMGKDLYNTRPEAKKLFEQANDILGFSITDVMFEGDEDALKQTNVTQPAVFLHAVIAAATQPDFRPGMVAGHSLGEFSALVANRVLHFEDALRLVHERALAMQEACEINPSTMAAILGLSDEKVEEICSSITEGVVIPANYNCPGQVVISGSLEAIQVACQKMKEAGAKRALPLSVGGAFHSPLMEPAKIKLEKAINATPFHPASCPIYQNVSTTAEFDTKNIKENLIAQLTAPVKWTQSVQNMVADGATHFIECGPGKVLQGLVKKIHKEAEVASL